MCCLGHALVGAASPASLHSAGGHDPAHSLLILMCFITVFTAGMLTITDFIIILHRYYKSPMVGPAYRQCLPDISFSEVRNLCPSRCHSGANL